MRGAKTFSRKRIFETTNHSQKRLNERNIPHPHEVGLSIANKKTKKLIRESCGENGVREGYIYWSVIIKNERYVYVTLQINISHYLLITCFKYYLKDYDQKNIFIK